MRRSCQAPQPVGGEPLESDSRGRSCLWVPLRVPDREYWLALGGLPGGEEVQTHRVPGPGGVTRVGVGKPGRRTGVWRIWANKTTGDVYVAASEVMLSLIRTAPSSTPILAPTGLNDCARLSR